MRTIKPLRLAILTRVLELGRRPHLVVSVFAAMKLGGAKELLTEVALWKLVEKCVGTGAILDESYSKPAGELVIHGSFHAPQGKAEPVSFAGIELTQDGKKVIDKRLAILGRREWKSGLPTHPEPVETLRLDWSYAFGGEDHPTNAIGRGMKPKDANAPWLLPQIEDPHVLIRSPSDRPQPAGCGPLDLGSIERRELAGSYGGDYVETRFPGPAADMDPRFFHTAREDQRIQGFFRGGEKIAFVNMHPEHSRIEGVLPPLVARALIQRGEGAPFSEVPLRIDTLIAFPGEETIVAVHRGMVAVEEDDASDITNLILAAEDPSMPRSVDHYKTVMMRRTDREKLGALWAFQDEDLMPQKEAGWGSARMPEDDVIAMAKTDGLVLKRVGPARERRLNEQRDALRAQGLDPDLYLPIAEPEEAPPPVEDVSATIQYIEKLKARSTDDKAKAEARKEKLYAQAREEMKRVGKDWDAALDEAKREAAGPPKDRAKDILSRMREQATLARNTGAPRDDMERVLEDPKLFDVLKGQEKQLLDGYRMSAHYREPARRLDAGASGPVRQRFMDARTSGTRPENVDGTGADLSALDLSAMDLAGALFECADLSDAVFDRANLENGVLTRAKLDRARFASANLNGANLGDTTFVDVDLSNAQLHKAMLVKSRFEKASFVGATLSEAFFLDASFGEVDFSRANLEKVTFSKLDLRGARFTGANLEKAQFVECDLSGVDFSDAKLDGAILYKTRASGACFARASMLKSAWPAEVVAPKADFRGAHIELACLRGANLENADFTGATLVQCDFGNANLTGAILTEANARGSMFIRANLNRVNARGASFVEAIMSNALLPGADFSKANMFRAVLSRARGDDKTRFTGANVEVVLHEPRYEGKPTEVNRG